ncbi:DsbA family protein [Edaphobacter acidisoli]|uniref:DsbA family protein n=1 Tax=Edaphobacter acidisoli TaxID=2040573 RepID=UPI00166A310C|nr:thioredoxin domain-containing protein [Edaphobacter acidisoli]
MQNVVKPFRILVFALTLAALGCHAQTPALSQSKLGAASSGDFLSPDLARRVEVQVRSRFDVPPDYEIHIGSRTRSDLPGYDAISVTFSAGGKTSRPITFLLSTDNKTLAQFTKFDISKNPRDLVSDGGRPSRGGPASAPVIIVGFDDLECPFCARMNAQLFPSILQRYGDKVHFVYRDFPLYDKHPWAMRAAVDVNCVGDHSPEGYWNLVDYIHAHAAEMGGQSASLAQANQTLDTLTREEGKRQHIDAATLDACIAKQDTTAILAEVKEGEALGVEATPALFINGEKIEGAEPLADVYRMIDSALIAAGQTPPPPAEPAAAPAGTPPETQQTPAKTGN